LLRVCGNQQGLISSSPNKHRRESRWPAIEGQVARALALTIIDLSAAVLLATVAVARSADGG